MGGETRNYKSIKRFSRRRAFGVGRCRDWRLAPPRPWHTMAGTVCLLISVPPVSVLPASIFLIAPRTFIPNYFASVSLKGWL
jgi:hypothetical protein